MALDAALYGCCGRRVRLPAGDVLIATSSGAVHVRTIEPAASRGGGADVVIIPDAPFFVEHAAAAGKLVASLGRRVFVIDLPGFGLSRPSATHSYDFVRGADVLRAVLDALGVRRAVINACCVNGYYALALARASPDCVAGLVLAQAASVPDMHAWAGRVLPSALAVPLVGQLLAFLGATFLAAKWIGMALPRAHAEHDARVSAARAAAAHVVADCGGCNCLASLVQGLAGETAHITLDGPAAAVPVIAVWGASDRSHRLSSPTAIRRYAPQALVRVLEPPEFHAGHVPTLEYPETLVEALLAVDAAARK